MKTLFITGTDTGVGKTHVSSLLLSAARAAGVRACGYKPVASGCERIDGELRNEDALALQAAAGTREPYAAINPYAFEPAIAPHIAARQAGVTIDLGRLTQGAQQLEARHDWLLVEGAGGWLVPLNEQASFADWVAAHGWPVLLVVAMRLGCINHALLSAEAIRSRGLRLIGWVANELPPAQPQVDDNVRTLEQRLDAPLLARLSCGAAGAMAGDGLLQGLRARLPAR
ncbi:dethiobiotin synthase [Hydrocarboniphaga sp.]|uniref:dethiobiotin synthase n=1 Tax=Hydrocarboniphaga sp. TaxID=2033016 RepID=UPI003D0E790E